MKLFYQEHELIAKIQVGESLAVKYWFDQYYPQLLLMAKNRVGNTKDAEDLVQETFINCLRKIHLFRAESSLKTWMMAVLRHEIADYYRKIYAKKAIQTLPLSKHVLNVQLQDSGEVDQKVRLALNKMLNRRKSILLMKYVDGLGVKQIAKIMGKTFKAVESDLCRARKNFKQFYAADL